MRQAADAGSVIQSEGHWEQLYCITATNGVSWLPVMRYSADGPHADLGVSFSLLLREREGHRTPFGIVQKFIYCL